MRDFPPDYSILLRYRTLIMKFAPGCHPYMQNLDGSQTMSTPRQLHEPSTIRVCIHYSSERFVFISSTRRRLCLVRPGDGAQKILRFRRAFPQTWNPEPLYYL